MTTLSPERHNGEDMFFCEQSDSVDNKIIIKEIGRGVFGCVYEISNFPNIVVKEFLESKKITQSMIRELASLVALRNSSNIVKITGFDFSDRPSIYLEKYTSDLKNFISSNNLSYDDIIDISYQLLNGLYQMHCRKIYHRDLKTINILIKKINNKYNVSICDFGLTKFFVSDNNKNVNFLNSCRYSNLSPMVQTLHYRAPEILLTGQYDCDKVDIWSVGVIIAELFTKKYLFPNWYRSETESEVVVIEDIFKMFGTPTEESWNGITNSKRYKNIKIKYLYGTGLPKSIPSPIRELLYKMLTLNPEKRITLVDALNDPIFSDKQKYLLNLNELELLKSNDMQQLIKSSFKLEHDITYEMLEILFIWILNIVIQRRISFHVYFLTCKLIRLFLLCSSIKINKDMLQLVGISILYISSCVHLTEPINYTDLTENYLYNKYERSDVNDMIKIIIRNLDGDVYIPTIYDYFVIKSKNMEDDEVYLTVEYLLLMTSISVTIYDYDSEILIDDYLEFAMKIKNNESKDEFKNNKYSTLFNKLNKNVKYNEYVISKYNERININKINSYFSFT